MPDFPQEATDVWAISGQFFAEHQLTPGFHPSYRHEEPASTTTCVTLLTGGLLIVDDVALLLVHPALCQQAPAWKESVDRIVRPLFSEEKVARLADELL